MIYLQELWKRGTAPRLYLAQPLSLLPLLTARGRNAGRQAQHLRRYNAPGKGGAGLKAGIRYNPPVREMRRRSSQQSRTRRGDTAGRLQNKVNLMNELSKMRRVIEREIPGAPHEVWLVLDATTGQNGIQQAKVFLEATKVSGIILTKMDGTAKGGIVMAIRDQLGLPVRYIGLGEQPQDLRPFDIESYLYGICEGMGNHE